MIPKRTIIIGIVFLVIAVFGYRWYIKSQNPIIGYQNGLPVYIGTIIPGSKVSGLCSDYPYLAFQSVNGDKYLLYSLTPQGKFSNFNDGAFINKKVKVVVEKIEHPSTLAISCTSMTNGMFYTSIALR